MQSWKLLAALAYGTAVESFGQLLVACCKQRLDTVPEQLRPFVMEKVSNVIRLLKLSNAEDTFIGNDLIRGVSGGERKRVTIAEMIMGVARVLVLGT